VLVVVVVVASVVTPVVDQQVGPRALVFGRCREVDRSQTPPGGLPAGGQNGLLLFR